jgi:hypothetical integral membrane protein (TIGR02206 family)
VAWTGWRWQGTPAGRRLEVALACGLWGLWLSYQLHGIATTGFDVRSTLPLQLCDFTAMAGALALVRPRRVLHALAWFWGVALSSQAILTPDLTGGPGTLAFWAFWAYHTFLTAAAVYVVVVRGFRPTAHDLRTAVGLGVLYAVVVASIDAAFQLNYGYLGAGNPSQPSLLDHLGPYPYRILSMVLVGTAAMTLCWLPWAWVARRRR